MSEDALRDRRLYLSLRGQWTQQQWRRVRFSDECHFGQGPKRKLKLIRRRGERFHTDCIQGNLNEKKAVNKNTKRFHIWAAIGYGFKSELVFYEVLTSSNGKMTNTVYVEKILKGVVKQWIERGDDFILEEDRDTGHGTGDESLARRYKQEIGLEYFFNAAGSPDLAPIENIWRSTKQQIASVDHWDDDTLKQAIKDAWAAIKQPTIDKYIDSMQQRMKDLDDAGGQMTGW